eukprot:jgi/Mesvir1/15401/Mv06586-RA.1
MTGALGSSGQQAVKQSSQDPPPALVDLILKQYPKAIAGVQRKHCVLIKQHTLPWILKRIEDIYDGRYQSYQAEMENRWEQSPELALDDAGLGTLQGELEADGAGLQEYVLQFSLKQYGLRSLVDRAVWELLCNAEAAAQCNAHLAVDLFCSFLQETYSLEELFFFLHCRHHLVAFVGSCWSQDTRGPAPIQGQGTAGSTTPVPTPGPVVVDVGMTSQFVDTLRRSNSGTFVAEPSAPAAPSVSALPPCHSHLSLSHCLAVTRAIFGGGRLADRHLALLYRTAVQLLHTVFEDKRKGAGGGKGGDLGATGASWASTGESAGVGDGKAGGKVRITGYEFLQVLLVLFHATTPDKATPLSPQGHTDPADSGNPDDLFRRDVSDAAPGTDGFGYSTLGTYSNPLYATSPHDPNSGSRNDPASRPVWTVDSPPEMGWLSGDGRVAPNDGPSPHGTAASIGWDPATNIPGQHPSAPARQHYMERADGWEGGASMSPRWAGARMGDPGGAMAATWPVDVRGGQEGGGRTGERPRSARHSAEMGGMGSHGFHGNGGHLGANPGDTERGNTGGVAFSGANTALLAKDLDALSRVAAGSIVEGPPRRRSTSRERQAILAAASNHLERCSQGGELADGEGRGGSVSPHCRSRSPKRGPTSASHPELPINGPALQLAPVTPDRGLAHENGVSSSNTPRAFPHGAVSGSPRAMPTQAPASQISNYYDHPHQQAPQYTRDREQVEYGRGPARPGDVSEDRLARMGARFTVPYDREYSLRLSPRRGRHVSPSPRRSAAAGGLSPRHSSRGVSREQTSVEKSRERSVERSRERSSVERFSVERPSMEANSPGGPPGVSSAVSSRRGSMSPQRGSGGEGARGPGVAGNITVAAMFSNNGGRPVHAPPGGTRASGSVGDASREGSAAVLRRVLLEDTVGGAQLDGGGNDNTISNDRDAADGTAAPAPSFSAPGVHSDARAGIYHPDQAGHVAPTAGTGLGPGAGQSAGLDPGHRPHSLSGGAPHPSFTPDGRPLASGTRGIHDGIHHGGPPIGAVPVGADGRGGASRSSSTAEHGGGYGAGSRRSGDAGGADVSSGSGDKRNPAPGGGDGGVWSRVNGSGGGGDGNGHSEANGGIRASDEGGGKEKSGRAPGIQGREAGQGGAGDMEGDPIGGLLVGQLARVCSLYTERLLSVSEGRGLPDAILRDIGREVLHQLHKRSVAALSAALQQARATLEQGGGGGGGDASSGLTAASRSGAKGPGNARLQQLLLNLLTSRASDAASPNNLTAICKAVLQDEALSNDIETLMAYLLAYAWEQFSKADSEAPPEVPGQVAKRKA